MNRLKLWLFVVLLLGAGAGNLYFLTGWLTARSVAHMDRELRSSASVADARIRLLGASVAVVADAAARSPAVVAAFADPAASPLAPAEDAVQAAAAALKADASRGGLVAVAGPQGAAARAGGPGGKALPAPEALLAEAQAGRRSQAWVRLDGTLWMIAAVPAGRGGAVAVGLPLDAAWLQALRGTTGVEFTSVLDGNVAATTLPAADASAVATATQASQAVQGRRPADVGRLGRIKAALDWPVPALPILFADPPAARALALGLDGAGPAALVLSIATAPFFSGLAAYQLLAFVAMALFLLVGLLLGLFMSEDSEGFPRELVSAADRVSRGDFAARAPVLAGSAGRIATALNRAAEAAQLALHPQVHAAEHPAETTVAPSPAASVEPAPAPVPHDLAAAVEPVTPAEAPHAWRSAEAAAADGAAHREVLAPAPVAHAGPTNGVATPEPAAVTQPLFAGGEEGDRSAVSTARESGADAGEVHAARFEEQLISAAGPLPEAQDEDEPHWRTVFDDFVRMRAATGEPAEHVSYDRFRARLERNRQTLMDKHGARTVRFQPYVKDGKVALRATPVK